MTYEDYWHRLSSLYDTDEAKAIVRWVLDVRFGMSFIDVLCGKISELSADDQTELKKIMLEKPLDRIRVSDIVNRCGISRRTFYYHFADVYEALAWMLQEDWKDLITTNETDWESTIEILLTHFQDNLLLCRAVLSSSQHFRIEKLFCSKLEEGIGKCVHSDENSEVDADPDETSTRIQCLALAMTSIIIAWINREILCSKKQLIKLLKSSI